MKEIIYKIIKIILPNRLIKKISREEVKKNIDIINEKRRYMNRSYAQEGEDMILKRYFNNKKNGFYIDIGAHHPRLFSNTYIFYLDFNWRGINVDPLDNIMDLFNDERPEDINIEAAVTNVEEELIYYKFNIPALNTLSKKEYEKKIMLDNVKLIEKKLVKTVRLDNLLDKYLPENKKIDFLSIDVEGEDFNVLKSNNWEKYRPEILLVEDLRSNIKVLLNREITKYLLTKDYEPYYRTYNTIFFKDIRQ